MSKEIVGKIPEFTDEASEESEEVKESLIGSSIEEEKETPTELPAEEEPAEEDEKLQGEDTEKLANQGLLSQREKLLTEIQGLRKERRGIREQKDEPLVVEDKLDDIDPEYTQTIERVIKARGYITKEESSKLSGDANRKAKLDEFLEKYPEYKPENDINDVNWNALQKELEWLNKPSDPQRFAQVLQKAHNAISKPTKSDRSTKKLETARLGSGGVKRSSSQTSPLTEKQKNAYRNGGWSEEEIADLET